MLEIPSIPGDDTLAVENGFSFITYPNLNNGEVIFLEYELNSVNQNLGEGELPITAATPVLSCFYHEISDTNLIHHKVPDSTAGNFNGHIEPGEVGECHILIENSGLRKSRNTIRAIFLK